MAQGLKMAAGYVYFAQTFSGITKLQSRNKKDSWIINGRLAEEKSDTLGPKVETT